ncbi:MAG: thiamine pyrophosphate-binding protein [Nannocystis sp.]|uniref:thiamine pyrophosphate-binding protein n=1 Tax=Nannocystis sp. TaxID=1962667 RepID=UPI0024248E00|nr:thiamine pyrophosphate-binding protein [Nannocystis sp.]MBK9755757.1 thiamine pyrophosphate-binding protein [Nannocystis sp.]
MDGGALIAEVLRKQGVRFLFTLCGGHISPILVGAKRADIRVIDVRHEVNAVFAADAVARLTGVPGVAAVTAGPGLTNTITAVKNAQLAQSPVIILGGATATVLKGRGALQDIDQLALMRPHVKWAVSVSRVRDLVPVLERAFAVALSDVPGPVFVECPVDLLYAPEIVKSWYSAKTRPDRTPTLQERALAAYLDIHTWRMFAGANSVRVGPARVVAPPHPPTDEVRAAAKALQAAQRPVMVIGSQAMALPGEARAIAGAVEALGVPVYLSGMARGLLGAKHRLQMRHARKAALKQADLVLLAGVPCDFRLDYGAHIGRKAVYVAANRSEEEMQRNRRPQIAAPGDAGRFLQALAQAARGLGATPERGEWVAKLRAADDKRDAEIAEQGAAGAADAVDAAEPTVSPLDLFRRLEATLPNDSVLVADGGDFVATGSYILRPRGPLSWLDPGVFGTLGVGAGFALGAKLVRPDAETWILYGDGSVGYSLAEFDTFVRHKVPVIALVGNDASWAQIAREQVEILGDPIGTELRRTDYHTAAAGFGGVGLELRSPERIDAVLAEARATAKAGEPVLINAHLRRTDFRKGSISM